MNAEGRWGLDGVGSNALTVLQAGFNATRDALTEVRSAQAAAAGAEVSLRLKRTDKVKAKMVLARKLYQARSMFPDKTTRADVEDARKRRGWYAYLDEIGGLPSRRAREYVFVGEWIEGVGAEVGPLGKVVWMDQEGPQAEAPGTWDAIVKEARRWRLLPKALEAPVKDKPDVDRGGQMTMDMAGADTGEDAGEDAAPELVLGEEPEGPDLTIQIDAVVDPGDAGAPPVGEGRIMELSRALSQAARNVAEAWGDAPALIIQGSIYVRQAED